MVGRSVGAKPGRVAVKMNDIDGDIFVYEKLAMILRMDCGSASSPLGEYQLSTSVADGTPLVTLPDGRVVNVTWQYIIALAVRAASMADSQARTEPHQEP